MRGPLCETSIPYRILEVALARVLLGAQRHIAPTETFMNGRFLVAAIIVIGSGCKGGESCPLGAGGRGASKPVCPGEAYDVNGNAADGCEVKDNPTGNHDQNHAVNLGGYSACDDNGSVGFDLTGSLPSDDRCHEPAIQGYDAASGSAPDWLAIVGNGHVFCENDLVVTLVMKGTTHPTCYHFVAVTDKNRYECTTDANGTCGFNYNSGNEFLDGSTIYFEVSKTCGTNVIENPTYRITGHL